MVGSPKTMTKRIHFTIKKALVMYQSVKDDLGQDMVVFMIIKNKNI